MPDIFMFDTNSFITPYKTYYSFDFAPQFWRFIEEKMQNGNIVVLDKVYNELLDGDDDLCTWAKECDAFKVIEHKNPEILAKYSEVLEYIQVCGYYNERALAEWADEKVADAWLIASAIVNGYIVVTFESTSGGLNTSSKSSNPKIPDVCKHFNVGCVNLFTALRDLSFIM